MTPPPSRPAARTTPPDAPPRRALPLAPSKRRVRPPTHLADLDVATRRTLVQTVGEPGYRADQVSRHYFGHLAADQDAWSDIPAASRGPLIELLLPDLLRSVRSLDTDGGMTRKVLWSLTDGSLVESVLMRYDGADRHDQVSPGHGPGRLARLGDESFDEVRHAASAPKARRARATVCVSSQAGCGMGCPFCATGQGGLARSLSTAEIVDQVVQAARALAAGDCGPAGTRLTNVVFMGMGEPLANYRPVVDAIRRIVDPVPAGLGRSVRGITVSTVGLVPAIKRLSAEGLPVTLALSLHAPDDGLRDELVPINTRWSVAQALDAARGYFEATGRRVSIEYALIRDVNDQAWRAELLATHVVTRGRGWAHVNLIPLNPTPGGVWAASGEADMAEFVRRLQLQGVPVTIRDTRGQDIDGACGQLAARE